MGALLAGTMGAAIGGAAPAGAAVPFAVTATVPVGHEPVDLAADPATDMVYVSNAGDGTVSVINGATNQVTDVIQLTNGAPSTTSAGAIAVYPDTDTIYVVASDTSETAPEPSEVTVINGATNDITATVLSSLNPVFVAVNPVTNILYVTGIGIGADPTPLYAVNASSDAVLATVNLPSGTGEAVINSTTNTVYVASSNTTYSEGSPMEGISTISVINGSTNDITATITASTAADNFVESMAVDPTTGVLYVLNESSVNFQVEGPATLYAINGSTDRVTGTIATGTIGAAVGVDPSTDTVFVTDGQPGVNSGSLLAVNGATNAELGTVPNVPNPFTTMAVDPITHTVYIVNINGNSVTVVSPLVPTTLTTPSIGIVSSLLALSVHFSATLTAGGAGLAGQTVTFSLGKTAECSGMTNSKGVATCSTNVLTIVTALLSESSTATFTPAANSVYEGSSATAAISLG
jgi:YVTN family beta-propeller protein